MPTSERGPQGVALVTGASRGIGLAIAHALAAAGYRIALTARDEVRLEVNRQALAARTDVVAIAADLRNPVAPAHILSTVTSHLGPPQLIVNNAGTAPSNRFDQTTEDDLEATLDLHVRAPFRLIQRALPSLREQERACVIQLASTAGLQGFPFTSAYTIAKHGMVGLTRALAAEFGDKPPSVYALCPGFVDTDITRGAARDIASRGKKSEAEALAAMGAMNTIGRLHTPEDVAAAVVHLATELPDGCIYNLDQEPPGFV